MASTTGAKASGDANAVTRLGLAAGQVVQEFGYDSDVDADVRSTIEETVGGELVDEEYGDVCDVSVLWWRDDDGDQTDLADALVDAQTVLDDGGPVWAFTPKAGRPGHVAHSEIEEAAKTAGLHVTSTFSLAPDWSATRLGAQGRGR